MGGDLVDAIANLEEEEVLKMVAQRLQAGDEPPVIGGAVASGDEHRGGAVQEQKILLRRSYYLRSFRVDTGKHDTLPH